MKIITQEDDLGCGAACVAMILNVTYSQALKFFDNGPIKAKTFGFTLKDICKALEKNNLAYEYKYFKPHLTEKLNESNNIVFMGRTKLFPNGHYVLKVKNGWFDPWIYTSPKRRIAGIRKELPQKPIYILFRKE